MAAPKATSKWDDLAVKDLIMAIVMSTSESGAVNIPANWDKVESSMNSWGYGFTKSAMNQHWTKKILKEFKARHSGEDEAATGDTPIKAAATATPRKRAAPKPKTPASGRGKKRAAAVGVDDDDSDGVGGHVADPIAKNKTPRSAKKPKYDAAEDDEVKAEAMEMDENMADEEDEMEAQAEVKAEKEDSDFAV